MHFPDLSPCHYHSGPCNADEWHVPLLTVGWLEHPHPFPTGEPLIDLATRLEGMIGPARDHYPHHMFRGLHGCDLCDFSESLPYRSCLNFWIPGECVIYLAPGLITHYIRDHRYHPPAGFIAAVMACPEYGSDAYRAALRAANGGHPVPLLTDEENKALREKQREGLVRRHGKH